MPDNPLLTIAEAYRRDLERRDAAALGRLTDAYRRAYSRLADSVELLLEQTAGQELTTGQLYRLDRYKSLMNQIADELQGFSALTRNEIERAAELGIDLGINHARGLISTAAVGSPQLAGQFNALPKEAVESLLGFLSPQGPLYQRLALLAPHTASLVSDAMVSGIAMGYNPRKIAALVQDAFGAGLTDALRFVRTAQLWSYRESNRATFLANDDVVEGWQWSASFDSRTCMACLAKHGTIHPLSERLNDHHNGRCAMVPVLVGQGKAFDQTGEAWFNSLTPKEQIDMMGKAKWDAWQEGKITFDKLAGTHVDGVYGEMITEASLVSILGE